MQTIKTATGKEYPVELVSEISSPSQLFLYVCGELVDIVATFSNPEETILLTYRNKDVEKKIEGYNKLIVIAPETNYVRLTLTKE